jgi:hypothetical protein
MNYTNVTLANASPSLNLCHSMPKGTIIGLAFVSREGEHTEEAYRGKEAYKGKGSRILWSLAK